MSRPSEPDVIGGATVVVPLEGMSLGEQVSWYQRTKRMRGNEVEVSPVAVAPVAIAPDTNVVRVDVPRLISEDFLDGALDLSARPGAPVVGWQSLPEVVAVDRIKRAGATATDVRQFLTLVAAMDRAREADRLWAQATRVFEDHRWAFMPDVAIQRSLRDLRDVLAAAGVSQRHGVDAAAWRFILESFADERSPAAVRHAVIVGEGNARELLLSVSGMTEAG